MNTIIVSVVCYNNEDEVVEFARKIAEQNIINRIQLVVTCNSCSDVDKLKDRLNEVIPFTKVFEPEKNLGYLNGCLYGILESECQYSWAVICNTDITIIQNEFFSKILGGIRDDVWSVGPDIVLAASGDHQNPFYTNRPTLRKIITWRIAYSFYPFYWLYTELAKLKRNVKKNSFQTNSRNVYSLHGSFFAVKKECIEKIVAEKAPIFMYDEELLIAEIIRENNKKCYYNADVMILHNENQVTGSVPNKQKQEWFRESVNYIYSRFFKVKDGEKNRGSDSYI